MLHYLSLTLEMSGIKSSISANALQWSGATAPPTLDTFTWDTFTTSSLRHCALSVKVRAQYSLFRCTFLSLSWVTTFTTLHLISTLQTKLTMPKTFCHPSIHRSQNSNEKWRGRARAQARSLPAVPNCRVAPREKSSIRIRSRSSRHCRARANLGLFVTTIAATLRASNLPMLALPNRHETRMPPPARTVRTPML